MKQLPAVVLLHPKESAVKRIVGTGVALFIAQVHGRKAGAIAGVGREQPDLSGKLARPPDVVGVLERDVGSASLPQREIAEVESAVDPVGDDPQPGVVELSQTCGSVVTGAIIQAEDFEIVELIEHGLEGLPDERSVVVGSKYD